MSESNNLLSTLTHCQRPNSRRWATRLHQQITEIVR